MTLPFHLQKILRLLAQTLRKPRSYRASFNSSILLAVSLLLIHFFLLLIFFISENYITMVILNNLDYNWTWSFSRLPRLTVSMTSLYVVRCNFYIYISDYCFDNCIILCFAPYFLDSGYQETVFSWLLLLLINKCTQ